MKHFKNFQTKYCLLLTKMLITDLEETPEGYIPVQKPIKVLGYLIDQDDEYFYVGESVLNITQAIKKTDIVHIELAEDDDSNWDDLSTSYKNSNRVQ